ncbi:MAG: hypothetical protein S4CHLAM2_18800 [Chlamydiales bacterium]|nr:hypothetical protein [Chlamydiales bacterium]
MTTHTKHTTSVGEPYSGYLSQTVFSSVVQFAQPRLSDFAALFTNSFHGS